MLCFFPVIMCRWEKAMAPYSISLAGKSHGWRSLVGWSPWGHEESDMTERLHFHFSLSCIGERNGNPLQCSCLENPRDAGPSRLPSMWLHRVGHDWSDLAVAVSPFREKKLRHRHVKKLARCKSSIPEHTLVTPMLSCLPNYMPSWVAPHASLSRPFPVLGQDRPFISLVFSPSREPSRLSVNTS